MRLLMAGILVGGLLLAAQAHGQAINDLDKTYRQDDPNPPALQGEEGNLPPVTSQRSADQCVEMARALRDFQAADLLAAEADDGLQRLLKALQQTAPAGEEGAEDPKTPFGDMVRIMATDLSAAQYDQVSRIVDKAHRRHGPHFLTDAAFEARLEGADGPSAKLEAIAQEARAVTNELMYFSFDPEAEPTAGPPKWSADLCRQAAHQQERLAEAIGTLGPFYDRIGSDGPLAGRAPSEQDLASKKLYEICRDSIQRQRGEHCP